MIMRGSYTQQMSNKNNYTMKTTYTIEFYDPMTSHWWVAGKLIFMPDDYLAERSAPPMTE